MEPWTDKDGEVRDLGGDNEFWEKAEMYHAKAEESARESARRESLRIDAGMATINANNTRELLVDENIQNAYEQIGRAVSGGLYRTSVVVEKFALEPVKTHLQGNGYMVWPYLGSDSLLEVRWGPKPVTWRERYKIFVHRYPAVSVMVLAIVAIGIPLTIGLLLPTKRH